MNMSEVITPKSDQINADDLIGRDMTITIRDVQIRGGQEQPVSILFDGSDKAFRPCKSMSRVLVAIWGADARQYIGRSLTLYRDPTVKWGGMEVGGIRISHASDMERAHTMALTATKGSRKPYTVKPLVAQADKVADGVRALIERIRAGEDVTGEEAVQKQRAWLAKNRPELAAEIDTAIATQAGPFEGPADDQRGEAYQVDADWLIDKMQNLARVGAVTGLVASWTDAIASFPEEDRARLAEAQAARIAAIKGADR